MSPNPNRILRDYFPGINLTFVGLLCAAAVLVASLNRSAYSPVVLAQGQSTGRPRTLSPCKPSTKPMNESPGRLRRRLCRFNLRKWSSHGCPRWYHNRLIARTRDRGRNKSTRWAVAFWSPPMGIF